MAKDKGITVNRKAAKNEIASLKEAINIVDSIDMRTLSNMAADVKAKCDKIKTIVAQEGVELKSYSFVGNSHINKIKLKLETLEDLIRKLKNKVKKYLNQAEEFSYVKCEAKKVAAGKYGNGNKAKQALKKKGYSKKQIEAIQKAAKKLAKKGKTGSKGSKKVTRKVALYGTTLAVTGASKASINKSVSKIKKTVTKEVEKINQAHEREIDRITDTNNQKIAEVNKNLEESNKSLQTANQKIDEANKALEETKNTVTSKDEEIRTLNEKVASLEQEKQAAETKASNAESSGSSYSDSGSYSEEAPVQEEQPTETEAEAIDEEETTNTVDNGTPKTDSGESTKDASGTDKEDETIIDDEEEYDGGSKKKGSPIPAILGVAAAGAAGVAGVRYIKNKDKNKYNGEEDENEEDYTDGYDEEDSSVDYSYLDDEDSKPVEKYKAGGSSESKFETNNTTDDVSKGSNVIDKINKLSLDEEEDIKISDNYDDDDFDEELE